MQATNGAVNRTGTAAVNRPGCSPGTGVTEDSTADSTYCGTGSGTD